MVAQTQNVMFLYNCCSTTPVPSFNDQSCCRGTTGHAKEAEWRQNYCQGGSWVAVVAEWRRRGRHSDRSMDAIGRPKEAQWWSRKAEASLKLIHNIHNSTERPMADHCASILRPRRCLCLPPASLIDLWPTDLLGDLCAMLSQDFLGHQFADLWFVVS